MADDNKVIKTAPRSDESKDDFISRCMKDPGSKEKFSDKDQRLAVCHSKWNEAKKSDTTQKVKKILGNIQNIIKKQEAEDKQRSIEMKGSLQAILDKVQRIFDMKKKDYEANKTHKVKKGKYKKK